MNDFYDRRRGLGTGALINEAKTLSLKLEEIELEKLELEILDLEKLGTWIGMATVKPDGQVVT